MAEGLTVELIWITLFIGSVSFWISHRDLSIPTAFLVTTIKLLIPLVYFAFLFDGTWTFSDDIKYQEQGERMLELGYNPITVIVTPSGMNKLIALSEGRHILYGWWNVLSQYLFGQHYYSAVFLNIGLTFVNGYFLFRLARLSGFSQVYSKSLLLFFLLHWDVIAWSSFTNLKDIMVMTLTTMAIYSTLKLSKRIKIQDLSFLSGVTFSFFWLRFYVPLMLLISTIFWFTLYQKGRRRYILIVLSLIGSYTALRIITLEGVLHYMGQLNITWTNAIIGSIRMALTPQPWSIVPSYSFLFFPSVFHWSLFIPTVISGIILWRRSKEVTLLIIYLLLSFLLYSFYDELQGTRHRVQVIPIIVWLQFHFLWIMLQVTFKNRTQYYPRRMTLRKN